jgi:L-threonylcarbamoyladenylate synthase
MERTFFDQEVDKALEILRRGGIILYPTDTIWGIGCDATNEDAVRHIYRLKNREDSKSLIVLVAEEREILQYVASPDLAVFDFLEKQERPTTVIFDHAIGFPPNLVAADGSIAIRIVQDDFCRHLIKRLRKPLVSTSANISGQPSPATFQDIDRNIKDGVDYMVQWRQDDHTPARPSQIIRWHNNGSYTVIRS